MKNYILSAWNTKFQIIFEKELRVTRHQVYINVDRQKIKEQIHSCSTQT